MSRYKIVRELGRNREAGRITYLATDTRLNPPQQVVIKEFRFALADAKWSGFKAYQREIEVLRELDYARIPRYLDSFETKAGFCLVQEYKNAPSLAQRRSFNPEEIKQIAVSVLEILVYLQKRVPPIIHRDIKPENILVDKQLNAYLVDFGFARIQGGKVALSSIAAGTPGFMPPEELFSRSLTKASDLYSLGATLLSLLTGTRSVDIGTLIDDNYRFEFKTLVPQLSPSFISWLEKMVAPNLKQRFDNATVALEALKPIRVVGGATWQEILGYAIKPKMSSPVVGLAIFGIFALLGMNLILSRSEKTETSATPQPSVTPQPSPTPRLIESPRSDLQRLLETNKCVECNLQKANLVDANLEGANLQGANLEDANLERTNLKSARLVDANLQRAYLLKANLQAINLENANLGGAMLSDTNLENANLQRANLQGAGLNGTKLGGAMLGAANLAGAQMANANLNGAKVWEANLSGANLNGANLQGAQLIGSNLKGAMLWGANLEGANLRGATKLEPSQLKLAKLKGAIMPDGTKHE
jgi:uncharacterized protein YjbI with pentapeptide repeats